MELALSLHNVETVSQCHLIKEVSITIAVYNVYYRHSTSLHVVCFTEYNSSLDRYIVI